MDCLRLLIIIVFSSRATDGTVYSNPLRYTDSRVLILSCGWFKIACETYITQRRPYDRIDGDWKDYSEWSKWSTCSVTCSEGIRRRSRERSCDNPKPRNGGRQCYGKAKDERTKPCSLKECPVDGGWTQYTTWSLWDECSESCGGGMHSRTRHRSCGNPVPQYGGKQCVGEKTDTQTQQCNVRECPVDGGWTQYTTWSQWDECSETCGGGMHSRTRHRSCGNPVPQYGGKQCVGEKTDTQTQQCNERECPVDGGWTQYTTWSQWGECSETCGDGMQSKTRHRSCGNPVPQYGGKQCVGNETDTQSQQCNERECPVDGGWTQYNAWSEWDGCSETCGRGMQSRNRHRSCKNPEPEYGGKSCVGNENDTQTQQCKVKECPVDGGWTEYTSWSDWSDCSETCGDGTKHRTRTRSCENPVPQHDGKQCVGNATDDQNQHCVSMECDCKQEKQGLDYTGKMSVTKSGRVCQMWKTRSPHYHWQVEKLADQDNYCRNPDGEPDGPWCYTTDPNKRWEYCDIPLCGSVTTTVKP